MRLLTARRMPPDEQVRAARSRVAALRRRTGWVPRVPDRARRPEQPADQGGVAEGQRAADQPGAAARQGAPGRLRGPGRHAKPPDRPPDVPPDRSPDGPPDKPPDGPPDEPVHRAPGVAVHGAPGVAVGEKPSESVGETPEPRREEPLSRPSVEQEQSDAARPRGPVAAAVADRVPLAVRPLVEGLPAGVRRGRLGLQPSHALIIVLVVLLGVAVTALLAGLGRPKVSPVQPAATATVLATGTPVAEPEQGTEQGDDSGAPDRESTVVVHVAGKVASPGIVELPAGSRV
ncbi:MAG: hypothetical protein ACODAF_09180, partial [Actinomycetota bacterium]